MGSTAPASGSGASQQPINQQLTVPSTLSDADLKNIQGDIVLGLPKKKQRFFFFKITEKDKFRKNLGDLVPLITTVSRTQLDREAILKRYRKSDVLHMGGINVAFSWSGLKEIDKDLFKDDSTAEPLFEAGMRANLSTLKDNPSNWKRENWNPFEQGQGENSPNKDTKGFEDTIHGVVLIVGEDDDRIKAQFAIVKRFLADSVQQVLTLDGQDRPGLQAGNEHFGYKDGISQPFITGTEKWRKELPGQGAVKPGVILCGRDGDVTAPGGPQVSRQPWQIDGSFLAFRYLRQKVPEFDNFLASKATERVGKDLLGARMVGRWKSGAPLDIAPFQDDRSLAKDETENNNFSFEDNDSITGNPHSRCPFSSHIRKTNPRSDLRSEVIARQRIIRRGIPYGPEVEADETAGKKTLRDRGLLFVCYQSQLANGFELMQKNWANNPGFPFNATAPKAGIDPIIGQTHAGNGQVETTRNSTGLFSANAADETNKEPGFLLGRAEEEWVESRGGEYFFSPSISAIQKFIAL